MRKIGYFVLACVCLSSCAKDATETHQIAEQERVKALSAQTRTTGTTYTTLPNPYALDVMQEVYDTYSTEEIVLEPTDLYVRFLPQDSLQLVMLYDSCNLELFNHPLDIELAEGEDYVDPTIPEGNIPWLYTTVAPNFVFPEDFTYEILEECYIPNEDEEIIVTRTGGTIDVEETAFELVGYELEEEVETRGKVRPEGTIRVFDNTTSVNGFVPVKGVKIRCHRIVKWSTTYTDENGHYVMDSKFRFRPHYAIVFDNCKDFDIWGNWANIAKANYNMGWHSNSGHSRDIDTNSTAWKWCAINNAGYDYYVMCEETGIPKPPPTLKVAAFPNSTKSSAPMLRRISSIDFQEEWIDLAFYAIFGMSASDAIWVFRKLLPDVTIGCKGKLYNKIYENVNHEFAHASHFSRVGSSYWARYIDYIVSSYLECGDVYGYRWYEDAELCGVGEMWGYAMGYIQQHIHYSDNPIEGVVYPGGYRWFKPDILWDLYSNQILTKKQIFDCMTYNVDTYDELVSNMYMLNPNKANRIQYYFTKYGFAPTVENPNGEVIFTSNFQNQVLESDLTVESESIGATNITVTDNVTLRLNAESTIIINSPFVVQSGARLILNDLD